MLGSANFAKDERKATRATMAKERERWRSIVSHSHLHQKRLRKPQANVLEHPFCEERQLRDAEDEVRRNRNPQLERLRGRDWYLSLKEREVHNRPLGLPSHANSAPSFGHRPASASLHFDALTMSLKRTSAAGIHNPGDIQNINIPRAGVISSHDLRSLLAGATRSELFGDGNKSNGSMGLDMGSRRDVHRRNGRKEKVNITRNGPKKTKEPHNKVEVPLNRVPVQLAENEARHPDSRFRAREENWDKRVVQKSSANNGVADRSFGAPVNAVFGDGRTEFTQRRQKLKRLARMAAGLPDFHPFCTNKQIEDEKELSRAWGLSTGGGGKVQNKKIAHREYIPGSHVHSTTPRQGVTSEHDVKRLFEMYEAGKLGPDLTRMVVEVAEQERQQEVDKKQEENGSCSDA